MPSHSDSDQANAHEDSGWSTKTRLILAAIGLVVFIVLYLVAYYWLPLQWSDFITGITDGSAVTSWLLGLAIGFGFSVLPILVFLMGMRLRKSWKGIVGWLVVALVLALPNILTIGLSQSTKTSATGEQGNRTQEAAFDVVLRKAPGFTTASIVGVVIGVLVGLWVAWITVSRRRAKRKAERLAAEKQQQVSSTAANASDSAHATSDHEGSADASGSDGDGAERGGGSSPADAGADQDSDTDDADSGDGDSAPDASAGSWDQPSDGDAN